MPRAASSREQEDCTTDFHRSPTLKFIPQTQGIKTYHFKKQRQTRRVSQTMGRQTNPNERKGGSLRKNAK